MPKPLEQDKIKCPQCNIEIIIPKSSLFISKEKAKEELRDKTFCWKDLTSKTVKYIIQFVYYDDGKDYRKIIKEIESVENDNKRRDN